MSYCYIPRQVGIVWLLVLKWMLIFEWCQGWHHAIFSNWVIRFFLKPNYLRSNKSGFIPLQRSWDYRAEKAMVKVRYPGGLVHIKDNLWQVKECLKGHWLGLGPAKQVLKLLTFLRDLYEVAHTFDWQLLVVVPHGMPSRRHSSVVSLVKHWSS